MLPALVAVALTALAVALVARSLAPAGRVSRRLGHVQRYGTAASASLQVAAGDDGASEAEREGLGPIARLGHLLVPRLSAERVQGIRRNLLAAGRYETSAETFIGTQALTFVGVGAVVALAISGLHTDPLKSAVLALLGVYVGVALPAVSLARKARARLAAIEREMPELVDVLVVAVEAGLGLIAALDRAAERAHGPLGDELRLLLLEHSLGATVRDALANFGTRADTGAVRSFTRTLTQGDRLGVSIGQLLRAVAEDMRKRRISTAQEIAHRTPVKVLFPLVFCIFPAMMIVLLAPAAMRLVGGLGHG